MTEKRSWTKAIFVGLWSALNFSRRLVFNIIFIAIIVGILVAAMSGDSDKMTVSESSALVLNLKGNLVIEKQFVDPAEEFFQEALGGQQENPEILVRDLVKVIENAAQDKRIEALVLSLDGFGGGGLDKLAEVSAAMQVFKESGKPIYAMGNGYSRNQYYLAANADAIYLHPMGSVILEGYASYGNYFKDGLENIKASTHVFKVGKFKSAVEPFTRNDMSDEAKEANVAWLNELWAQYKEDIATARPFDEANFDETFDSLLTKFEAVNGDTAQYALDNGWVDGLRTKHDFRSEMTELLGPGEGDKPYNYITFNNYLDIVNPPLPKVPSQKDQVAIVVAKGTITDGVQKPGSIGGDSTAALLRQAREDDKVKAVVLQVDSGGGSAFASEVIRNEVVLLKQAGKPVVATMSSVAASGGYWISASADHIIAEPSTITGSIGIFGMFTTFENSLAYLGVYSDGVSTTELNGIGIDRELADGYKKLIQMNIERGYERFISLVASERGMTAEAVDEIAQGRVWVGTQALELGLVDELGGLDLAIEKAAELASLEDYVTNYVTRKLSPKELFWQNFFQNAQAVFSGANISIPTHPLMLMAQDVEKELQVLTEMNDPMSSYVLCLECKVH
ncbi:signal peptide peptidase SppA [Glaciecola sp. XM2]|jgi:protease-4|uniref:signal peptide peptidase SppA n=1 Tax=Glaciecola sp. XM2 TaxID=1914931 RepID=UPI001BDF2CB3|nr:signal peptide peptidase SppA [Glaciecola sp. XM2]MBT1449376.1 signal peptide peptidase SppA [Glaciecola sp. XM2]